jgi:hypothetical protein
MQSKFSSTVEQSPKFHVTTDDDPNPESLSNQMFARELACIFGQFDHSYAILIQAFAKGNIKIHLSKLHEPKIKEGDDYRYIWDAETRTIVSTFPKVSFTELQNKHLIILEVISGLAAAANGSLELPELRNPLTFPDAQTYIAEMAKREYQSFLYRRTLIADYQQLLSRSQYNIQSQNSTPLQITCSIPFEWFWHHIFCSTSVTDSMTSLAQGYQSKYFNEIYMVIAQINSHFNEFNRLFFTYVAKPISYEAAELELLVAARLLCSENIITVIEKGELLIKLLNQIESTSHPSIHQLCKLQEIKTYVQIRLKDAEDFAMLVGQIESSIQSVTDGRPQGHIFSIQTTANLTLFSPNNAAPVPAAAASSSPFPKTLGAS